MADSNVREYTSKAGTEIHAVFDTVKFGDLHMVKYATQRDVANIHVMGRVDAVGTAKGKRQTTGACVFTIFQKDRLLEAIQKDPKNNIFLTDHELLNYGGGTGQGDAKLLQFGTRRFNTLDPATQPGAINTLNDKSIFALESFGGVATAVLADQIPPFDITLVGISEVDVGSASKMIIHGVQFTSDQGGTSIDDLVLERQLTFIARRISPWSSFTPTTSASRNSAGGTDV